MASSIMPVSRRVADAISAQESRPFNEDGIIHSLDPNGIAPVEGSVALTILQNSPSIAVGASVNGRFDVYWGCHTIRALSHPLDGQTLLIMGELTSQGGCNIVKPLETDFDVGIATEVYTVEDTVAAFEADEFADTLTPPASTRQSTPLTLKYRRYVHIPHDGSGDIMRYNGSLSARRYFLEFYPSLDTPEKRTLWKNVTEHFQVLAVSSGSSRPVAALPAAPQLVRIDETVGREMYGRIYGVLPEMRDGGTGKGLNQLNSTLATGFSTLQAQSDSLQTTSKNAARVKELEKEKKKTLEHKLGVFAADKLFRFLDVSSEKDLAGTDTAFEQWRKSESKTAESFRQVLEACVQNQARQRGVSRSAPEISLAMASGILAGNFGKIDLDDPSTGWFSNFILYGTKHVAFSTKQITKSKAGESDGVMLSAAEATELLKFKTYLPTTEDAHRNILRMHLVALAVFPPNHKFLQHLESLRKEWDSNYSTLQECVLTNTRLEKAKGIILLEAFSIKLSKYWERVYEGSASATIPPPSEIFDKMHGREQWVPHLTTGYLQCLGLIDFTGVSGDFWLENLLPDGSTRVMRADGGRSPSSGGDAPTALADPGRGTPGDTGPSPQNTTVKNNAYNEAIFGEFRRRKRGGKEIPISTFKKQAIAITPLPPSNFGAESVCLAWHVKGMCNANCRLAADHRSYSAAEYAPLVTWCKACYPDGE